LGGGGGGAPPPPGVAPEASEEWFDSFEVLMRFTMLRPVWLFGRSRCTVGSQVLGLVC
jgi:hypothetical protein